MVKNLKIVIVLVVAFLWLNSSNASFAHNNWRGDCVHVPNQWVSCGTQNVCKGPDMKNTVTTCFIDSAGNHSSCTTVEDEVHSANDPACTPACTPSYNPWNNNVCGASGLFVSCSPNQRYQTRTCASTCCDARDLEQCVYDPSCSGGGTTPPPGGGGTSPTTAPPPTAVPPSSPPAAPTIPTINGQRSTIDLCMAYGDVVATIGFQWASIPPATLNMMQIRDASGGVIYTIDPWPASSVKVAGIFQPNTTYFTQGYLLLPGINIVENPRTQVFIPAASAIPPCAGVPPTGGEELTVHVRNVTGELGTACNKTIGVAASGVNVSVSGVTGTNKTGTSGSTSPISVSLGTHNVSIVPPAGTSVRSTSTGTGTNTIPNLSITGPTEVTFCVSSEDSWFQTDQGDVRFTELTNPLPLSTPQIYGSEDADNPGVFFSSDHGADLGVAGASAVSTKGWLVDDEYGFNKKSINKPGTMSYSFYISKARREGVSINTITSIASSALIPPSGADNQIFEFKGAATISNPISIPNDVRVILLVDGDINIEDEISVGTNSLFILAASGNIVVSKEVGVESTPASNLSSKTPNLEGIYTAEKGMTIDGENDCSTETDRRLNVSGALIANSKSPFASGEGGKIKLDRSLCDSNGKYPALYVASRLDFLVNLTDFYKTNYSKWTEEKP